MEIVFRAAVTFAFLAVLMRAMGRRELSEITTFELVLLVTMGDLVQQGVTQEDMSLTGAMLAVGTIALLILATSYVSFRYPKTRRVLEGMAVVVVRDGRILDEVTRLERLTPEEIMEGARQRGIADLRRVKVGILEADGRFSFITGDGSRPDGEEPPPRRAS
ncbi:MAG TPA: YetF domain-containing protein [Actinomycetota bacterium]|nr:YetF domain-containing protein [Actinomycetota bacterium]